MILKDAIGTIFNHSITPKRIVSLVPSQTELLCDLGLEAQLVGVTKFCVHPYHLKSTKTIVGGTKNVNFDKVKALAPDIIIANKEENTLEAVQELQKIALVWVTDIQTIADTLQMIHDFGKLFRRTTEAQKWIDKISFAYQDFKTFVADKPSYRVVYFIWANPYMVAAQDTFIHHVLSLNGFVNCFEKHTRYPEIALETLRATYDPELILLSSEPFPFKDEHAFDIGQHIHHAKTIFVDGEMFSWYGTRLIKAFAYFKKLHQVLAEYEG